MPLSTLQRDLLTLLAQHRDETSFVAGAMPIAASSARFSEDIDIFNDSVDKAAEASQADEALIKAHGFNTKWIRRLPGFYALNVARGAEETRLEWVRDSDYRFFPAVSDPLFGFRLHHLDIAVNKLLAAAGREEPRDVLDLLFVHDHLLPLAGIAWAAVGKDPGFVSPESLLRELARNAVRYSQAMFDEEILETPVDAGDISRRLRAAIREAEGFALAMRWAEPGVFFIRDGAVGIPDPADDQGWIQHAGTRGGHWPSSSEILSEMLPRSV